MNITITKQTESPLLSRKRIISEVSFKGKTPSRLELKKELASKLKTKQELIEIRHIYGKFGEEKAKLIAHVYEDEKVMKALVHKKKEKEVKEEKKPEAEAPKAEVKKEEPKKEEKKPEVKKEDKK
tara:strand:+ start:730 stop:1104 length:375 start_codon:yes stop_codon:yes gene_type:complete